MENDVDKTVSAAPGVSDNNGASVAPGGEPHAPEKATSASVSVRAVSDASKKRRRVIGSVTAHTVLNYCIFALSLLVVLWAVFFFGLYSIYGTLLRNDMDDLGRSAIAAFPTNVDDNSMELVYRTRLTELARSNSAAFAVFFRDDFGNYECRITVDSMDMSVDTETVLESVLSSANFTELFTRGGTVDTVGTQFGTMLCYGDSHDVVTGDEQQSVMYLLAMKPYAIFNSQVVRIVVTLIICTIIALVLACIFSFFAARYQTKHLKDFSQKAKALAAGDRDVVFSGDGYEEYEALAGALNAATRKMEQSEQLQRDLVANVSHDIRTPLTMIKAYAEMLRDMPVDGEKRARVANVIISESDRLTSLVTDALNYSRLQAGVVEFKYADCDISSKIRTVVSRFDIYREKQGFEFITELTPGLTVNCDENHIEQVLYNLINNAINYSGEEKVVIVRAYETQEGNARIEVTDKGKGIKAEDLDTVWDRYYRTAHAKRTSVGTGLGLSICKNILVEHGAHYGVQSQLGVGSTFWFELASVGRTKKS